jgi:hypothetical protein
VITSGTPFVISPAFQFESAQPFSWFVTASE